MTTPGPIPKPRPGPVPGPLGSAVAWAYGRAVASRNRRFNARRGVTTLDIPVISVGNLSVGGTGKTPLVEHLARLIAAAGLLPCIALRGYRAKDGLSDEAEQYRTALADLGIHDDESSRGIPVVVNPDRIAGLRQLAHERRQADLRPVDCVILDDGFQHRRLDRRLDIVLADATRDPFDDHLLPRGWLREPCASLARAHALVITRADLVPPERIDAIRDRALAVAPRLLVAASSHAWASLRVVDGPSERTEPVEWLLGKRLFACCAIGNPDAFLAQVARAASTQPADALVLRDHDPFDPPTIDRLIARAASADAIIVTEKDWTKLRSLPPARWPCPVVRPALAVRWLQNGDAIERRVLEVARGWT